MDIGALEAVLDRLIPADDISGAVGCGLAAIVQQRIDDFEPLLLRLRGFENLEPAAQDAALRTLEEEADSAFAALVDLAHTAYYADPSSWQALGYTTNVPGRP